MHVGPTRGRHAGAGPMSTTTSILIILVGGIVGGILWGYNP
jgi:hypothetical protein